MVRLFGSSCVLLAITMLPRLTSAAIITMSTDAHPLPSQGRIEFYVGAIGIPGFLLYTLDGLMLDGTAVVDVNVDASGNGSLMVISTNLVASDVPNRFADLGLLGTADVSAIGLTLNVYSGEIPVTDSLFTVSRFTPGSLDLVGGQIAVTNPTGIIGSLLPSGFQSDFGVDDLKTPFSLLFNDIPGSVDDAPGLLSPNAELNLGDPQLFIDLYVYAPVLMRFVAEVHLAAIPEASSLALLGLPLLSIAVAARRRWLRTRAK